MELLLREEHHRVEGGAAEGVAARLEARGVGQQVQVLPHLLVEDGGGELGLREDGHVVHVAHRGRPHLPQVLRGAVAQLLFAQGLRTGVGDAESDCCRARSNSRECITHAVERLEIGGLDIVRCGAPQLLSVSKGFEKEERCGTSLTRPHHHVLVRPAREDPDARTPLPKVRRGGVEAGLRTPSALHLRCPRGLERLRSMITAFRTSPLSWIPAECSVHPWAKIQSPISPVNSTGRTSSKILAISASLASVENQLRACCDVG